MKRYSAWGISSPFRRMLFTCNGVLSVRRLKTKRIFDTARTRRMVATWPSSSKRNTGADPVTGWLRMTPDMGRPWVAEGAVTRVVSPKGSPPVVCCSRAASNCSRVAVCSMLTWQFSSSTLAST